MRALGAKEKEETRKLGARLTGRQLFEQNRALDTSDNTLVEEGTEAIDVTQFDRSEVQEEEDEGIAVDLDEESD